MERHGGKRRSQSEKAAFCDASYVASRRDKTTEMGKGSVVARGQGEGTGRTGRVQRVFRAVKRLCVTLS